MKDYVNKYMTGFSFGNVTPGVRYHSSMDKNIGKIGKIIDQDSISVKVRFDNNVCFYPISVAQHHITTEKEYQKSKLIEIMREDEKLGLYNEDDKNIIIIEEIKNFDPFALDHDNEKQLSQSILEYLLWDREKRKKDTQLHQKKNRKAIYRLRP
jgi:hypothetical protein